MKYLNVLALLLFVCCESKESHPKDLRDGMGEKHAEISNGTNLKYIHRDEVEQLYNKVKAGDAESAYQLYLQFAFAEKDYGVAYYWILRARDLGSPKVNVESLRIAEGDILSHILHSEK